MVCLVRHIIIVGWIFDGARVQLVVPASRRKLCGYRIPNVLLMWLWIIIYKGDHCFQALTG